MFNNVSNHFSESGSMATVIHGLREKRATARIRLHTLKLILKRTSSLKEIVTSYKRLQSIRRDNTGNIKVRKYVILNDRYSWSIYIPPFPSNGFNQLINLEIDHALNRIERVPLHFIFLSITKKCPLSCKHCFEWDIMHEPEKLSLKDLKAIVDEFISRGITSIFLTGGEPLSRFDDLLELVKYTSNRCRVWLFTSGFGLSHDRAAKLKKAGLSGAIISIDHYDEDTHNAFRGSEKSYIKAVNAVQITKKAGLIPALSNSLIASFVSQEFLSRFMEFANKIGAVFVQFMEPVAVGKYKDQDISLNQKQLNIVTEFYRGHNESRAYLSSPLIIYQGYHQRRIGCHGAGKRFLYVDSNGEIQACPFCQNKMGNALRSPINYKIGECQQFQPAKV